MTAHRANAAAHNLEAGESSEKVPQIQLQPARPVSAPPGEYGLTVPDEREAKHLREQERARTASVSSHNIRPDQDGTIATVRHKPSQALSIAASAAPQSFRDLTAIYNVVSSRRESFDQLLWQWFGQPYTVERSLI